MYDILVFAHDTSSNFTFYDIFHFKKMIHFFAWENCSTNSNLYEDKNIDKLLFFIYFR